MLLEIILAFIAGILAGTFTGLAPGIHINLVSAILVSSLAFLVSVPPIALVVFIVAMAVTHSFLDFITSIYLGAPEEDNFLSILPGHQMLKEGKGHEAIVLTLYGSLAAIPIVLIFIPIFIYLLPLAYETIKSSIPYILLFASFYLIFREKEFLPSLTIFILAGFLGFSALNLPIKEPLLPMLTGLFGLSSLLISIKNKTSIPKQKILPLKKIKLPKLTFIKSTLAALISAPLCSFLPGIGSGHAAVIGSEIFEQDNRSFLYLVGAINTIVISLSFIVLYTIGKSRSGVAAAVKDIISTISLPQLAIIILTIVLAGIISFFWGIKLSKLCAIYITKISYTKLSLAVIFILIALNIILTNWLGILVLLTATALGIFAISSGSRRINLMGCLLVPTIIYYLLI